MYAHRQVDTETGSRAQATLAEAPTDTDIPTDTDTNTDTDNDTDPAIWRRPVEKTLTLRLGELAKDRRSCA
jgi:hypothetical protein